MRVFLYLNFSTSHESKGGRHEQQRRNTTGKGIRFAPSGSNDYGGIRYNSGGNDGWMEFWTSDDYGEPFVFRAYDVGSDGTGAYRDWFKIQNGNAAVYREGTAEANFDLYAGSYYARSYYRRSNNKYGLYLPSAAGNYSTRLSWDGTNDRWTATGEMWAPDMVATSDIRFKRDLVEVDNAISKVKKLTGYTYTQTELEQRKAGIIAQELQEVLPEGVITDPDGKLGVSTHAVTALLVNAIKEQQTEIDELKALVKELINNG